MCVSRVFAYCTHTCVGVVCSVVANGGLYMERCFLICYISLAMLVGLVMMWHCGFCKQFNELLGVKLNIFL